MELIYTLAFFGTLIGLWRRVAVNLEAQGRGWYFRNWIGCSVGLFVAILVTLMTTADSDLVSLIGFSLSVAFTTVPWLALKTPAAPR